MTSSLTNLKEKLENAFALIKGLEGQDLVDAGKLWNTYSLELQLLINADVTEEQQTGTDEEEEEDEPCSGETDKSIHRLKEEEQKVSERDGEDKDHAANVLVIEGSFELCSTGTSVEDRRSVDEDNIRGSSLVVAVAQQGGSEDLDLESHFDEEDDGTEKKKLTQLTNVQPRKSSNSILEDLRHLEDEGLIWNEEDSLYSGDSNLRKSPNSKAAFNRNRSKCMQFPCGECGVTFATKGNLNVHLRKHNGDMPFPCTICSKRFNTSSNLRRHLLTHQGVKPYPCTLCDARFTEKKSLLVHVRQHTGDKPYTCSTCSKSFASGSVLRQHLQTHKGKEGKTHLCHKCGKSFTQKSQLRLHDQRHSGIKPHVCAFCDSPFTTRVDLHRHEKSHSGSGVKHLPCPHEGCEKSFIRSYTLKEHLLKHQNPEPNEQRKNKMERKKGKLLLLL